MRSNTISGREEWRGSLVGGSSVADKADLAAGR